MALALRRAARLTPGIRLAQAISEFEASLSDRAKADFKTLKSQAQDSTPGVQDVMTVTAEINRRTPRAGIGPRFTNMLMAVQQFATIGDVIIGGSQNLPACGVWCVVRTSLTLLIGFSSHLERFSSLFMEIGRSSPRYQNLALLYSCSDGIKRDLTEYFVVVVNICQQFVVFSNKPKFMQLTTSAFNTSLRQSESDLKQYALNIKEEVETLNTKTLVYESHENSRIRALVDRNHRARENKQKLKRLSDYLSACTDYDHETPWKQARKRGNTKWFTNEKAYMDFKSCQQSSVLVLSGKLGSGKTVLAANAVDDLILSGTDTVCYFFVSHDISSSCQSSIIMRSLCRQLLARHTNDDAVDLLYAQDNPVLDDNAILNLLRSLIELDKRVFFVLDGLDDCDDEETHKIVSNLRFLIRCEDLIMGGVLLIFASLRSQTDDVHSKYRGLNPERVLNIPNENPDIGSFIDSELTARIESDQLVFGDPTIVVAIRDALLEGAHGMFLWVVLQLDCLCKNDVETDESIRRSLQDMPKDLYSLFSRILQRAKVTGPSFQNRLLKILVAAQRPLTLDEMREALSIIPADATWRPQQQINNIAHALASCGSLVVVDEEEGTVRFVHQSVSQFLLQGADNETTLDWHFTSPQASLELGQLLVTYLSYGVFDRQLSTTVVPNITVGQAPAAVVQHILKDGLWRKAAALKLLRLRSQRDPDLGRTITEVSGAYRRSSEAQEDFHLLEYARKHWIFHTKSINSESVTFALWRKLLTHPSFAEELRKVPRPFVSKMRMDPRSGTLRPNRRTTPLPRGTIIPPTRFRSIRPPSRYWTDVYDNEERYIVCEFYPEIIWAITNSHLGLLTIEIRGKHALKALCGTIIYLLALQRTDIRPQLDRPMWEKLGKFANAFRMEGLATDISRLCNDGTGRLMQQCHLRELHRVEQGKHAREQIRPIPRSKSLSSVRGLHGPRK